MTDSLFPDLEPTEAPPTEQEILISMDGEGVHIVHADKARALEKKNLSPSLITGISGCPASWAADNFAVRDLVTQEPDNAMRRGNLFHKVMEEVFARPGEERTPALMKAMVEQVMQSADFVDLSTNEDVVAWLRMAINNYYSMGARPEKVKIANLDLDGRGPKKGLELFVKGTIGNASRKSLGFIDRLVEDERSTEGAVIIEDWKTGAKAKHWKSHTKSDEGLPEQRQQVMYSILLKQKGIQVSGARLIYPVAKDIVKVDLEDEILHARVLETVDEADKKLTHMTEQNTFEYRPSALCAWCPVSKICSAATILSNPKMRDAYKKQPTPEVLLPGISLL
jgi:RecB family exonuclease